MCFHTMNPFIYCIRFVKIARILKDFKPLSPKLEQFEILEINFYSDEISDLNILNERLRGQV